MRSKLKIILTLFFILGIIGIFIFIFLIYGPFNIFRDWLINTSMSTRSHKYIAKIFYDDNTLYNYTAIEDDGYQKKLKY